MPLTHRSFNFNVKTQLNKSSVDWMPTTFHNSTSVANQILFLLHKLGVWFCKYMKMSKNVHQNIWGNFFHGIYFLFKCVQIAYLEMLFFSAKSGFWHFAMFTKWYLFGQVCPKSSYNSESLCFSMGFLKSFCLSFSVFYASGHLHFHSFSIQFCCYKTFIAFDFVINGATVWLG